MNKQFALPGILLFFIGGVVGAAGHILLADESRTPALGMDPMQAATAKPRAPDKLAEALRELSDVLTSMRASLELLGLERDQAAVPENTRTELTPQLASDPSLAQAIKQLSAAISGMPSGGGRSAGTSTNMLAHRNWVNRREAFASDTLFATFNSEEDGDRDRAQATHLQKHMFWNYQDMLNAYGRPDGIETDGDNVEWYYNVSIRDGFLEYYYFNFHDGLLVDVNYDREEV